MALVFFRQTEDYLNGPSSVVDFISAVIVGQLIAEFIYTLELFLYFPNAYILTPINAKTKRRRQNKINPPSGKKNK